jgi:hypothetical protein
MILGPHTITRIRTGDSPGNDAHGNPIPGDEDRLDITGCSVQPVVGGIDTNNRWAITTVWTVWAPLDADVLDTDEIAYAGTTYLIDGSVQRWDFSGLGHMVIPLKDTEG